MAKKVKKSENFKEQEYPFENGIHTKHTVCSSDGKTVTTIKVEGFNKNNKSLGKAYYTPRDYLDKFEIGVEEYHKRFFN